MTSGLVQFLLRFNGWRLWVPFALLTVLAAELVVSAMDLLLMGRITADYLITGLVAAGLVAPISLFLMNRLLVELGRQRQADLAGNLARAEARLRVALDSTDEGILMVSLTGEVLSSNKRFRELWHVTEELADAGDDALLAHVLDQLVDPEGFMAGVRKLYGSDAEASDTLLFKDGRVFSRYTRALAQGDMAARIWCFRDISAQVRAQNALVEREEIFRAIVSQAGDGIDLIDAATLRFVEVNDAACRMLGYRREELIGQPLLTIQVDFDEASLAPAVAELVRLGHREFDARHRCKDGRILDVSLSARVVQLHGHDYVVGVWRDMTASKAAETRLREREEIFSAIVNHAVEGMLLVDVETLTFAEFNDAACEGLDYTREEFARLRLPDVQASMSFEETLAKVRVAAATPGGMRFENRHRCKDGSLRDRVVSNRPVQLRGRTFLAHVWHDVTESKRGERELVESRKLLQAVVDTAPMRVFWKDRDLKYLGCNPAFARDAGKSGPAEVIGLDDFAMGWAEMAELYRADDRAVMQSGQPKLFFEEPQATPDGRTIWLSTSKVPLRASGGEVIGVLGIYEDVTERKSLEDALRLREQYQRTVLDNFPFMVWLKDSQSRFLAVNQRFAEVFGQPSPQSLVGKTDLDIAPREMAERYREDDFAVLASGQPKNVEEQIEIDGRPVWFETYKSPVCIAGQVIGTVGFAREISDRKRMERSLALAIEVSRAILWELDLRDGKLTYDRAALAALGLESDTKLDTMQGWIGQVHPDDKQQFEVRVQGALGPGEGVFDMEYRLAAGSGHYEWVHTRGRVLQRDEQGQPILAVGTTMNITERRQISDAVQASERRSAELASLLRLMCDNVPDMIWAKDLDRRYLFANKAISRQLLNAVDTSEPLGKDDMFFARRERDSHPDDAQWHTFGELCQDSDGITLERGQPSVFEEFGQVKGRLTYLDVHKAPFVNEKGEVIGIVGSARDITERKQIEDELARHREHLEELVEQRTSELLATEARASRILESAADGLYGVDLDGRVTFINPAACKLLGYGTEQVLGRSAHEMFHHRRPDGSPFPEHECPGHMSWQSGKAARFEDITYWHADGHAVEVSLSTHPLTEGGKVVGAVVSIVDVGVQRAATRAREQALIAAENLARARSEFLANMSHEIRTPMNGVLGFAQIGYRNFDNSEMARDSFAKIIASGNQLLGVVNEILDFSKIDAGQLRVESIDMALGEALNHAVAMVAERAAAKGLELRLEKAPDLPSTCMGDPLRFGQVLLNLLTNAIKFTEKGSVVLAASRQGEQLVLRVSDTGIGMSREQLRFAFDPFRQADGSITRKFGGTGLGLAISRRMVELMRGEIRVESEPGVGSSFEVRLPYLASTRVPTPAVAPDPAFTATRRRLDGISILVAEDDPVSLAVLEFNLAECGARLTLVGDGSEAVERVIADGPNAYDIVLMDIQMPVMDGYTAARRLLQMNADLPIVGQTAHAYGEERDKCFAAGMAGHIAKPIDFAQLVDLVLKLVPTSRRRRAAPPAGN
ncbi:MAG: PAS domain S-box protein [Rhodocyclales bacterium]|nr:PAS domain S-box protein [Rhodocyclales bacterium]